LMRRAAPVIAKAGFGLVAVLVGMNMYALIAYDSQSFSDEELLRLIEDFPLPPLPWENGPV
jgi:hypothetical protein